MTTRVLVSASVIAPWVLERHHTWILTADRGLRRCKKGSKRSRARSMVVSIGQILFQHDLPFRERIEIEAVVITWIRCIYIMIGLSALSARAVTYMSNPSCLTNHLRPVRDYARRRIVG